MKLKKFVFSAIFAGSISLTLFSCGGGTATEETDSTKITADSVTTEVSETKKTLAPGMTPFDFPTVPIKAEPGDNVLIPSFKMWQHALEAEDPTAETYILYSSTISATGEIESDISYTNDGIKKMPNSVAIVIPKGQTAKKGDILLTWWQTGSGMQRAIVIDDSKPTEPIVMYLDLDYNNPAIDSKSGKSIGQTEYQLKADSFIKISDPWQEGNMIAAQDQGKWKSVQIVKIAGDKVLTIGFAGKMKVFAKADCKTIPIVPEVKVGDKVQAVFVGSFNEYPVTKIDKKTGRVFVTQFNKEKPIPYGQVAPSL